MNKLTAIALSILLLGQSFQVTATDLLQLDDLYLHATEHIQVSGNSVLEFISLHYGNEKIAHSKEHSQHKNLPFQQEIDVLTSSIFYVQEHFKTNAKSIPIGDLKSLFHYLDFQSSFNFQPIILPPIRL